MTDTKVYVVLYKSNCGDGTTTSIEELFRYEQDAEEYIKERENHTDSWVWFEIEVKELL